MRRGGTLHIDRLKSGDLEALDLNSLKRIPRHNVKAPGRQRYLLKVKRYLLKRVKSLLRTSSAVQICPPIWVGCM